MHIETRGPGAATGAFRIAENQYPEVAAFERVLEVAEALPVPERKSPRSMLEDVIVQLNGALATARKPSPRYRPKY